VAINENSLIWEMTFGGSGLKERWHLV